MATWEDGRNRRALELALERVEGLEPKERESTADSLALDLATSPELRAAVDEGELDAETREALAQLDAELEEFSRPPGAADAATVDASEAAHAWETTRERLFSPRHSVAAQRHPRSVFALPLAAALAAVALGLGFWAITLQRTAVELRDRVTVLEAGGEASESVLSTSLGNVFLEPQLQRGGTAGATATSGANRIVVPPGAASVTLLFHSAQGFGSEAVAVRLLALDTDEGAARLLWQSEAVQPTPEGSLALVLPMTTLSEGPMALEVTSESGASSSQPARFVFEIVPEESVEYR